jgi:pimeloyl-ACP methyl ester carboxylesterase
MFDAGRKKTGRHSSFDIRRFWRIASSRLAAIGLTACLISVSACSTYSAEQFADYFQMLPREIEVDGFRHLVYQNTNLPPTERLHIYIEGDGNPGTNDQPSADPTPSFALALRLANVDLHDVAWIGRPCYYGMQDAARCDPKYWTSHRYSEEVVHSMASVIEQVREPEHVEIVLIGYGGGGTIAALLESRVEGVVAVATIAGNLDIDEWARQQNVEPLHGSLNPAQQDTNPEIPKYQLVGDKDHVVPMETSMAYGDSRENVNLTIYDGFDHLCCWERKWSEFLADLSLELAALLEEELPEDL